MHSSFPILMHSYFPVTMAGMGWFKNPENYKLATITDWKRAPQQTETMKQMQRYAAKNGNLIPPWSRV